MEKQENFNLTGNKKTSKKEKKFTKTTLFLTRCIFSVNFEALRKTGFVDSYVEDPTHPIEGSQDKIFLLFKNKNLTVEDLSNIINVLAVIPINIIHSYELVNDYSMIVIEFPKEFSSDYKMFLEGKYSKFSKEFKETFPETRDVFNERNQKIGEEYTIYYHIFNRTDWLKNYWLKRLNLVKLEPGVELWQQADDKDLVFDVNSIL